MGPSSSLDPTTLRKSILHMAHHGQSVHVPCAFSMVEIVSVLYSAVMKFDRSTPHDPERDYLFLSKGHGVMALYACFEQLGWLERSELDSYFKDGTRLRGLCEADIPGLEVTSGSLGHGLPVAAGVALGLKLRKRSQRVFCIVGDGELNEGSMWEAILFAGHHQLNGLTVIVDANGFQAMGSVESILNMEPMVGKFSAFGFDACECDGHDPDALKRELMRAGSAQRPKVIVARTIKGKGISFMENDNAWHYTRVSAETLERALKELG